MFVREKHINGYTSSPVKNAETAAFSRHSGSAEVFEFACLMEGRRAKTLQIDPPDSGRAAAIRPAGHRAEPARRSNGRALRPAVIPSSHGALAVGHGSKPANSDPSADLKAAANRRCRAFFTAD